MMQSTAIIVFARAPQLGHVKTRLIPALGAHGALALYRAMLWHALHIADECAVDELILACTPDTENAELQAMAKQVGATLEVQRGADLGARMQHALHQALRRHQIVLLMGSDCPSLRSSDLLDARNRLIVGSDRSDPQLRARSAAAQPGMVFIPATDGGYVLLAATRLCDAIFQDMPWGGEEVMNLTRQRLRSASQIWLELESHSDVDRPQDVDKLPDEFRLAIALAPNF